MYGQPPIPFYRDQSHPSATKDDCQTFLRTDPNDATVTTKIAIPIYNSPGTAEDLLRTIQRFKRATSKLGWTTGPKKFSIFELLLSGPIEITWDNITNEVNQTNETFKECLDQLIRTIIPQDDAFLLQKEHLSDVHKTRETTVSAFAARLEDLNLLSAELPGKDEDDKIFSDYELTRLLFKAMPKLFRHKFRLTGRTLTTETFESLKEYFLVLEELYPSKPAMDTRANNGNNGRDSANNSNRRNNNRRNNNNNRNDAQPNFNKRNPSGRSQSNHTQSKQPYNQKNIKVANDDICPVHGGHTWGQCFFNPNGSNYNPYEREVDLARTNDAENRAISRGLHALNPSSNTVELGGPETQRIYDKFIAPPPSATRDQSVDPYTCSFCRKLSADKLPSCGRCKKQAYCSKDCQKKHWKAHKGYCVEVEKLEKEDKRKLPLSWEQLENLAMPKARI